jgi:hemerythrin
MNTDIIEWAKKFELGIDIIDRQHQHLVEITNYLLICSSKGQKLADKSFRYALNEAVDYTKKHFATEEQLMQKIAYPAFAEHKKEHDAFIGEVGKQIAALDGGGSNPLGFARFLRDWILNHIAQIDQKLADYLAAQQKK